MVENLTFVTVLEVIVTLLVFIYLVSRVVTYAYFRSKLDYFRTTSKELNIPLKGETDAKE